jgi:selenide,water dikinase
MTDVTGFGLLGHALEMAEGAGLSLRLDFKALPLIEGVQDYIQQFIFRDNTYRNRNAYSAKVSGVKGMELVPLCDPQTSGGLLISVSKEGADEVIQLLKDNGLGNYIVPIGKIINRTEYSVAIH